MLARRSHFGHICAAVEFNTAFRFSLAQLYVKMVVYRSLGACKPPIGSEGRRKSRLAPHSSFCLSMYFHAVTHSPANAIFESWLYTRPDPQGINSDRAHEIGYKGSGAHYLSTQLPRVVTTAGAFRPGCIATSEATHQLQKVHGSLRRC